MSSGKIFVLFLNILFHGLIRAGVLFYFFPPPTDVLSPLNLSPQVSFLTG